MNDPNISRWKDWIELVTCSAVMACNKPLQIQNVHVDPMWAAVKTCVHSSYHLTFQVSHGFFKFRILGHEEASLKKCTAVMDAKFSTLLRFPNAFQGLGTSWFGKALHLYLDLMSSAGKGKGIHHQLPPRFDCCHASTLSLCSAPIAAVVRQLQEDSHPARQCVHWRLGEFVVIHN